MPVFFQPTRLVTLNHNSELLEQTTVRSSAPCTDPERDGFIFRNLTKFLSIPSTDDETADVLRKMSADDKSSSQSGVELGNKILDRSCLAQRHPVRAVCSR